MDRDRNTKSWDRKLSPGEKRVGVVAAAWLMVSILMLLVSPKLAFGMMMAGGLVLLLAAIAIHLAG